MFNGNGTTLTKFNLPFPSSTMENSSIDRLILEELDYNMDDLRDEHQRLLIQLNYEQRAVYEKVLAAVSSGNGGFFSSMDIEVQGKPLCGSRS